MFASRTTNCIKAISGQRHPRRRSWTCRCSPTPSDIPTLAAQVDVLLDNGPLWGYLIDGHGLYAWGRDMAEARRHLDAFEFLIRCELEMRRLRP